MVGATMQHDNIPISEAIGWSSFVGYTIPMNIPSAKYGSSSMF